MKNIFIVLIICRLCFGQITVLKYERNKQFQDKITDLNVIERRQSVSNVKCGSFCALLKNCNSFAFNVNTWACVAFKDLRTLGNMISEEGWQYYEHQYLEDLVYVNDLSTFSDAVDSCKQMGKTLAVMKTPSTITSATRFIRTKTDNMYIGKNGIYIGLQLNTSLPLYTYTWMDGTIGTNLVWDQSNPADPEPNLQSTELCVRFDDETLLLRTTLCSKELPYLCN